MNWHYCKLEVTWFPVWFEFYITLNSISCPECIVLENEEKRDLVFFTLENSFLLLTSLYSHIMWVDERDNSHNVRTSW
jgi:hypothetical protein